MLTLDVPAAAARFSRINCGGATIATSVSNTRTATIARESVRHAGLARRGDRGRRLRGPWIGHDLGGRALRIRQNASRARHDATDIHGNCVPWRVVLTCVALGPGPPVVSMRDSSVSPRRTPRDGKVARRRSPAGSPAVRDRKHRAFARRRGGRGAGNAGPAPAGRRGRRAG